MLLNVTTVNTFFGNIEIILRLPYPTSYARHVPHTNEQRMCLGENSHRERGLYGSTDRMQSASLNEYTWGRGGSFISRRLSKFSPLFLSMLAGH